MTYYAYDSNGWLLGWHEDAARLGIDSTETSYDPIPPNRARWVNGAWVEDASREQTDIIATRIAAAWDAARGCIEASFDSYSQISATNLRMDPACPAWRSERIAAVLAWITTVWGYYAQVKASVQVGVDTKFDPAICGECPWTIWQIAGAAP